MERLISTNSLPSKLHLKPFPLLPQLEFSRFNSFSSLLRIDSRRPNSLSCKCCLNGPFSSSGSVSSSRFDVGNSLTSKDLQGGSESKPNLLKWVAQTFSKQHKEQLGNSLQQPGNESTSTSTRVYDKCSNNGNNHQGGYKSANWQTSVEYSCETMSEGCCQAASSVSIECANSDPVIRFLKFKCCSIQGR